MWILAQQWQPIKVFNQHTTSFLVCKVGREENHDEVGYPRMSSNDIGERFHNAVGILHDQRPFHDQTYPLLDLKEHTNQYWCSTECIFFCWSEEKYQFTKPAASTCQKPRGTMRSLFGLEACHARTLLSHCTSWYLVNISNRMKYYLALIADFKLFCKFNGNINLGMLFLLS